MKVSKASVEGLDANLPERLRREIEAMKQVDCENIARVLAGPGVREVAGEDRVFYIEQFYPGGTLDKRLDSPWAPEEVVALLRGLLRAVKSLETAGIVHRDIKPGSVSATPTAIQTSASSTPAPASRIPLPAAAESRSGSSEPPNWLRPSGLDAAICVEHSDGR